MRRLWSSALCGLCGCGLVLDLDPSAGTLDSSGPPADAGPCAFAECPPSSCAEIARRDPTARDGDYAILVGGREIDVYCDMTVEGGGWTGIVDFDASRDACLGEWASAASDGIAGCSGPSPRTCTGWSVSAFVPVPLESYREVLGLARGLQFFSTDAFHTDGTIDGTYVDGVSLTTGSPRQHVFTLASGLLLDGRGINMCPCLPEAAPPPAFVGDAWLCDSGNDSSTWDPVYYPNELWDLDADTAACAPAGDPGWFRSTLGAPASGPIEVRIMADQCDENVVITSLRLLAR